MKFKLAHFRERSTSGGWANFAVFGARSVSGCDRDNDRLLAQLTVAARIHGLRVDQSALVYQIDGQNHYYGMSRLVDYLSKNGLSQWTHEMDV